MSVLECCPCEKSVRVKLILSLLVINQFQMAPKSRRLRGKQASVSVAKPRSRYFFLSREEKDARNVARRGQRDSEIKARNSKRKGHRTDEASKRKPRPRKLQRELELMLGETLKLDETIDKLKHEFEAELRKKDELHERKMDELIAKHKLQLKAQPLRMAIISQGKKDTQPIINSHAAEIRALNKKHLQVKYSNETVWDVTNPDPVKTRLPKHQWQEPPRLPRARYRNWRAQHRNWRANNVKKPVRAVKAPRTVPFVRVVKVKREQREPGES